MGLSAYELSCGSVQQVKIKTSKIELYKDFNVYHVRRFYNCGQYWKCFDTLKAARADYKLQCYIAGLE